MPRGGFRVGAGRKKGTPRGVVLGMDRGPRRVAQATAPVEVPVLTASEQAFLVEPPASVLHEKAQACWRKFAGHAIRERTLTTATVGGFEQLCQQWAYIDDLNVKIQLLGPGTQDADPFLKSFVRLSQRLDGSLARFKLTAFGKPATAETPKAAVNPWAQVALP